MTESRSELQALGRAGLIAVLTATACQPGTPPRAPENDAANSRAPVPGYVDEPNVYETSAFAGATVQEGGGHHHHQQQQHNHNPDGHSAGPSTRTDAGDEVGQPAMPMDHEKSKVPK